MTLSTRTSEVTRVRDSTEDLSGITFDTIRNKIYFCSSSKMYRSEFINIQGDIETVLSASQCKLIVCLKKPCIHQKVCLTVCLCN